MWREREKWQKSREEEGEIVWRLVGSGREREIGEGGKDKDRKKRKALAVVEHKNE